MGQAGGSCSLSDAEALDSNAVDINTIDVVGQEPVRLNVYDVAVDKRVELVNQLFRPAGAGMYHAGVEVFGLEWSFGCRADRGSGVFSCAPRGSPNAGKFREAIPLGHTVLSNQEVLDLLESLELEWLGEDYDLISHNCCHFCTHLLTALGARPMPAWVTSLAGTGAALRSGARAAHEVAQSTAPSLLNGLHAGVEAVSMMVNAIDVVLECIRAPGVDVASFKHWERCLVVRVAPGRPQRIGPLHQPLEFGRLGLGDVEAEDGAKARAEGAAAHDYLFALEWEPPCLFLRKPAPEAALLVGGAPVRQPTYVLLNCSEIGVCNAAGEKAQLVFKVDRNVGTTGLQAERVFASITQRA